MSNVSIFPASKVPAFARNNALSDTARALTGGGAIGSTGKRISIKGGVFRLIDGGKEIAALEAQVAAPEFFQKTHAETEPVFKKLTAAQQQLEKLFQRWQQLEP